MKTMNLLKKFTAGVLAVAVIMVGMVVAPKDVQAADKVSVADDATVRYETSYDKNEAGVPVLDGYLFGGYYNSSKVAVENKDDATYAKFVPAHVLSIKAQNYANTGDETTTTTRLVTAVDCGDYQKVGFEVTRPSDGKTAKVEVTKVYNNLGVKNNGTVEKYSADLVFCDAAEHFAVLEYSGIAEEYWDENIYVKPYWVTPDNTTVYGLPKYVRVDDGIDGYISVAVNLKTAEAVAAGVVNVSYDPGQLKFDSYSVGKVFEEMEVADKGNSIKCVGNVEDITENATADDMYISLRFEVIGDYTVMADGGLTFGMDQIDFATKDEALTDTNVWDVLY